VRAGENIREFNFRSSSKWKHLILLSFFMPCLMVYSQDVLINETGGTPDTSAALEVQSTSKGVLVPRVTTTQMNAISSPATGLLVFNSTLGSFYFYNGSGWVDLSEDNLGDHKATQNVQLNNNYLSNDGDNEGIRIDNSGNVGIGTTSPSNQLTVFGTSESALALQSSNNSSNHGLAFQNNGGNYTWSIFRTDAGSNAADLVFAGGSSSTNVTSLTERMRINKDGEVGIGTNNPLSPLHILASPPANGNAGQLEIRESTTGDGMYLGRTQTYGYVQTQNAEPLSLNPISNNVGIGITTPSYLLDIKGKSFFNNSGYLGLNNAPSTTYPLAIKAHSTNGLIQFYDNGGDAEWHFRTQGTGNADLGFTETSVADNRLVLRAGGNVGIGIASPVRNFHIHNASGTTNYTQITNSSSGSTNSDGFLFGQSGSNTLLYNYENGYMQFRTNNTNRMRITNTGYVGIGETNPSHFLHITDKTDVEIYLEADSDNSTETDNPMIRYRQDGNSVGMNVGFDESNFGSNNFGIGRRWSSTDQSPSIVVEAQTGDVGINNTNPTVELDVTGEVKVSSKTTTTSLKVTGGSPASNKVLVSDADGDATWQDVPSKTHSISMPAITYSNDVLQSGTSFGTYGWNYRYVALPDVGNKDFVLSLMLPTGRTSNTITMRVSYTSNVNVGNFRVFFATAPRTDGETIGANPSGSSSTLAAPSTANTLKTWTRTFSVASADTYIFMVFRRSGSDALDTSVGDLRILGVTFDFEM